MFAHGHIEPSAPGDGWLYGELRHDRVQRDNHHVDCDVVFDAGTIHGAKLASSLLLFSLHRRAARRLAQQLLDVFNPLHPLLILTHHAETTCTAFC